MAQSASSSEDSPDSSYLSNSDRLERPVCMSMSRTMQFVLNTLDSARPFFEYVERWPSLADLSESQVAYTSYPKASSWTALSAASFGLRHDWSCPSKWSAPSSSRQAPHTHTFPRPVLKTEENHSRHMDSIAPNSSSRYIENMRTSPPTRPFRLNSLQQKAA